MRHLDADWITQGILDFEYKKYLLLAYLKEVQYSFSKAMLYPYLGDLVFHYNNLLRLKKDKEIMQQDFPKQLSKIDLEKLKLSYEQVLEDDEVMKALESILNYATATIEPTLKEGKEMYEFVERNLSLEPVGLLPLYRKEGYFFLHEDGKKEIEIYRYSLSDIHHHNEDFKALSTRLIRKEKLNFIRNVRRIKLELVKLFTDLPNPATFLIVSSLSLPLKETVIPVSKRILMRELAKS